MSDTVEAFMEMIGEVCGRPAMWLIVSDTAEADMVVTGEVCS